MWVKRNGRTVEIVLFTKADLIGASWKLFLIPVEFDCFDSPLVLGLTYAKPAELFLINNTSMLFEICGVYLALRLSGWTKKNIGHWLSVWSADEADFDSVNTRKWTVNKMNEYCGLFFLRGVFINFPRLNWKAHCLKISHCETKILMHR